MGFFPENAKDWRMLGEMIDAAQTVFVSTHVNPDGDAIGSVMALAVFLGAIGKPVRVLMDSPTPELMAFLDPEGLIEPCPAESPVTADDIVIFCDMGRYDRAGGCAVLAGDGSAPRVIIDHHIPEPIEAELAVVNTTAASTACLIYDFCLFRDASAVDRRAAQAVMTGVMSDTGYLRYSNTTERTLRLTADLYRHGVTIADVRRRLETGFPLCRQLLLGLTLSAVRVAEGGEIAYAPITLDMFRAAGAERQHTEGIIDHIRMIRGVEVAFVIIQEGPDDFKVSFRSGERVMVNELAAALGGGGHPRAAGAAMNGPLEEVIARVLDAAGTALRDSAVDKANPAAGPASTIEP